MKSVVLMFAGGLIGGMLGPVFALSGVAIGFVAGHLLISPQDIATD